jgi:hypothetical protein
VLLQMLMPMLMQDLIQQHPKVLYRKNVPKHIINMYANTWSNIVTKHGRKSSNTWSTIIKHHGHKSSRTILTHHQKPFSTIIENHGQPSSKTMVTHQTFPSELWRCLMVTLISVLTVRGKVYAPLLYQ